MRTRAIALSIALCFAAVSFGVASDMNMGTWKLNESKSKIPAMLPKNTTVMYEMSGDNMKVTVDGVDGEGKPAHNEWTGKFDGKDYSLTGDPTADMRSYKKIDDHTMDLMNKKDGKVVAKGHIVISADGKMRTVTVHGMDSKGKKFESTAVYDKQ